MPMPEKANSVMFVLPTITAPAARSRWMTGIGLRRLSGLINFGAAGRRLTGDIEQVLDRDDPPVEWA